MPRFLRCFGSKYSLLPKSGQWWSCHCRIFSPSAGSGWATCWFFLSLWVCCAWVGFDLRGQLRSAAGLPGFRNPEGKEGDHTRPGIRSWDFLERQNKLKQSTEKWFVCNNHRHWMSYDLATWPILLILKAVCKCSYDVGGSCEMPSHCIEPGEELFISYGSSEWFTDRGLVSQPVQTPVDRQAGGIGRGRQRLRWWETESHLPSPIL